MFDLYGNDRLIKWKEFRTDLENSQSPLDDLAKLWAQAPFVNSYIDPNNVEEWPDPWHLILDNRYDDLAIVLGMLYTLKLTQRFMDAPCEIHMSMSETDRDQKYFLLVDNRHILNLRYREVTDVDTIKNLQTSTLWKGKTLP